MKPDFNKGGGLLPTVVQDSTTKEVLMVAWMNEESFHKNARNQGNLVLVPFSSGCVHKGGTSGNVQHVVDMKLDCDGDTLLVLVKAEGPACHTGAVSCFFNDVEA